MNVFEVRSTGRRQGSIVLVPADTLDTYTGFRSVYGFPQSTADVIMQTGRTAGLANLALYSDTLFLDFDSNDEAAWHCAETLAYGYTMYNTGGRGFHFHIPIVPMFGLAIPDIQKAWVLANFPEADVSIYKTSAVIRLPGTFHAKHPGQQKVLVKKHPGQLLCMPMTLPETQLEDIQPDTASQDKNLEDILDNMLFRVVAEGTTGRNQYAFRLACVCRDLGYPLSEAMDLVAGWNVNFSAPPLKHTEIFTTCNSAYRR